MTIRSGFLLFRVKGKKAAEAFRHEAGGHRWQRVPPNEKRGRVHTSTVTVAVLAEPREHEVQIEPRDIEEKFTRGSGAGGQHRNKTDTAVVLKHLPSGVIVRIDGGRSQHLNRQTAMSVLRAKLQAAGTEARVEKRNAKRRNQVGSGMRGDKRRTIAVQRGTVTDHETGRTIDTRRYLKGYVAELLG